MMSVRDERREDRKLASFRIENGGGTLPYRVRCEGCKRLSPGGEGKSNRGDCRCGSPAARIV